MSSGKAVFEYERFGNVLIVSPTGSLMGFRDNDVRNAYNETYRLLDDSEVSHLLVDFSKLSYFASTFVGMLIRLAKKTRQGGGEAVLCHLSDNMKTMMKTLMLLENKKTDFFWVAFATREEAIASLPTSAQNGVPAVESPPTNSVLPTAETKDNGEAGGGGWARYSK